ncbi:pyridoxal phosphate-dependent aminotransferase [Streptomyces sp. ME02-8801-2C]|uniref:pyridoxal phosphate-dependent aminotransferase n=1 Tax=Streptomyces sp. ME02-8801-2C TaxID=3028680 RepID=UPI0029B192BB|nr:pyridoxal phosphate-dependent aminotransferase [Streptomyces sp. ME02-8801-2C]MDX3457445.1 pyridoxal phosphate-dependent aminotransferase [Streptomyces sp. ME02-8801-2C]
MGFAETAATAPRTTPATKDTRSRSAPARRLERGSAFAVRAEAARLEAAGRDVVHLELGEPDWRPPPAVLDALPTACVDGGRRYTEAAGDLDVRIQVADSYTELMGTRVDPERVVLVPGSNLVLYLTLLAVAGPGDEVLLPDPGFPPYAELVRLAGAVPVPYPLRGETGFLPDADEIGSLMTRRTRLIIVNSPNNPTGSVIPDELTEKIMEVVDRNGLYVVFDEAYREFKPGGGRPSLYGELAEHPRTVFMESLSKSHSMCGWRAGIAITRPELAKDLADLMVNTACCMPSMVQRIIPAALNSREWLAGRVAEAARRRHLVHGELVTMPGIRSAAVGEGLYLFPDITRTGLSDREFARRLLDGTGVSVVPGSVYGRQGAGHVRIACTQSIERLTEAMRRMRIFLEGTAWANAIP